MKPKNRWKPFSQKNINVLEKAYQSHLSGESSGGWLRLDTGLEVRGQTCSGRGSCRCALLTGVFVAPGELQWSSHDDASSRLLLSEEKLPAWDSGGVQAVGAPAQPAGPAALAAGTHTHTHRLQKSLSHLSPMSCPCSQVDNQLPGAIFPIVFHPVPPPKSIALDSGGPAEPALAD